MPPRALEPSGILLVDKPAGPSSFAIVNDVRRRTGARTGHAGTLDPFATGLLVLLSGRATRLASCFVGLDKRYLTDVDLTARTSTGDVEGEVVERHEAPSSAELEERLAGLRGEIELPIPAASAVKIGGERAYKLHRRGVAVEMPLRRSRVEALALVAYSTGSPRSTCASARGRTCARSRTRSAATAGRCGGRRWARSRRGGRTRERIIPGDERAGEARREDRPRSVPARAPAARGRDRHLRRRSSRAPDRDRDGDRDRARADGGHLRPAPAHRARKPGRAALHARAAARAARERSASRRRSSSTFTHELHALEPEEFADDVPRGDRRARWSSPARTSASADGRTGDLALLERLGFEVPSRAGGRGRLVDRASAHCLRDGDVAGAARMLGRPPSSTASSSRATSAAARSASRPRTSRSTRPARARGTASTRARRSATAQRSRSASTRTTAARSGASSRSCSTSRATSTASGSSSSSGSGSATSGRSRARTR